MLPRRVGRRGAHAFNEFRTDAFTVIRAIAESEHGALLTPAASGATTLELSPGRCALTACGFADGVNLMLLDSSGQFDLFTVTAVDGMAVSVRHQGLTLRGHTQPVLRWSLSNRRRSRSTDPPAPCVFTTETQPISLLDDVVDLRVACSERRAARVAAAAGRRGNCLYAADGTYQSALPVLGTPGRLIELTPAC